MPTGDRWFDDHLSERYQGRLHMQPLQASRRPLRARQTPVAGLVHTAAMYRTDGRLIVSPTDLAGFLDCAHLTQLDLLVSRGLLERPVREDPMLDMLADKGRAHEAAVLEQLRSDRPRVVTIAGHGSSITGLEEAVAETLAVMRSGADVIYQAAFFDGTWRGQADFLLRVEAPSDLGAWSYEVADAKLSWSIKAGARVQLCEYSLQVARMQGLQPERMHAFLGNGTTAALAVAEYAEGHLEDRRRFEDVVLGPAHMTAPEPVDHCGVCPWKVKCTEQWQADDHLSLVRGLRNGARHQLVGAGITSVAGLAAANEQPAEMGDATWTEVRDQARLQVRAREAGTLLYELYPAETSGLVALPRPSPFDLFFDMESQPLTEHGTLEYLFGITEVVDGSPRYRDAWGHTPAEEKAAFECVVDRFVDRFARHPEMHVYHYAQYEVTALRKLAARHGTRHTEVEQLVTEGVFVDLYAVVRSSVRVSQPSYSLKSMQAYFMAPREDAVVDAGGSMIAYDRWLQTRDPAILDDLRAYNEADCLATLLLRDWLEERRAELERATGTELPRNPSRLAAADEDSAIASLEVDPARVEELVNGDDLAPSV